MAVRSSQTSCKHRPNETRALFLPLSPFSLTTQQFHYFPPLFSSRAISVIIVRGDASIDRSIERSTPSAHQLLRARRNGCRLNRSSAFPPPFVVLKAVWEARTSYSRISTRRWGVTHHRYRLIAPTIKDSPTCA